MNYAVSPFKSIYLSPKLQEREEARGRMIRVFQSEGQTVASFEWGDLSLPLDLLEELAGLVGREIAILRLDGRFYVRGCGDA